jgi:hypothetical protein
MTQLNKLVPIRTEIVKFDPRDGVGFFENKFYKTSDGLEFSIEYSIAYFSEIVYKESDKKICLCRPSDNIQYELTRWWIVNNKNDIERIIASYGWNLNKIHLVKCTEKTLAHFPDTFGQFAYNVQKLYTSGKCENHYYIQSMHGTDDFRDPVKPITAMEWYELLHADDFRDDTCKANAYLLRLFGDQLKGMMWDGK